MVVGVFILAIIIIVAAVIILLIWKRRSKIHSLTDHIYRVSNGSEGSIPRNKPDCDLKEKETTTKTSANMCDLKSDSALGCIKADKQETTDNVPTEAQSSEVSTL